MNKKFTFFLFIFLLLEFHQLFAQPLSLVYPKNNFVTSDTIIDFNWNLSLNETDTYELEISTDILFSQNFQTISNILSNSKLISSLNSNTTYFWHIRAYNIATSTFSNWSNIWNFSIIKPSSINGLKLWLSADSIDKDLSDFVGVCYDKSGNNNNATQAIQSAKPLLVSNSISNKPAIEFTGPANLPLTSNLSIDSFSIFIVEKTLNDVIFIGNEVANNQVRINQGGNYKLSLYNSGQNLSSNLLTTPQNFFNISIYKADGQGSLSFFEKFDNKGTCSYMSSPSLQINRINIYPTGSQAFKIAEILIFNRAINNMEQSLTTKYLLNKYAPPVNIGADIKVPYGFCQTLDAGPYFSEYLWSNGATTQTIQINSDGFYYVTVTDIFGMQSSDTIKVSFPKNLLNYSDTTICFGNSISLTTDLSVLPAYSYLWSNGSTTSTISVSNPATIGLLVTDTLGCSKNSNSITISIDSLSKKVSLGPDRGFCVGNKISLLNYPENPNSLNFIWHDNSTDSTFIVNSSGNYWVTITNNRGCIGRDTINVSILGTAPNLNFSVDTVCFGNPISINNSSSNSYDSLIWDFGDGNTSASFAPSHTYGNIGTFSISLTEYSGNCSNTLTKTVNIRPIPFADFTYSSSCIGQPVLFNSTSNSQGSGTINNYLWDLDGVQINNPGNISHTFATAGNHLIKLNVTSSNGCSDSISKIINTVSAATLPTISLNQPSDNSYLSNSQIGFSWNSNLSINFIIEVALNNSFSSLIFSDTTTSNYSSTNLTLSNGQRFYWRVKAFNFCNEAAISETWSFTYFNPNNYSGLSLWLSADSGIIKDVNNKISLWTDLSSNNNDVIQPNPSLQPLFLASGISNKPSIDFLGLVKMSFTNNIVLDSFSIFLVEQTFDDIILLGNEAINSQIRINQGGEYKLSAYSSGNNPKSFLLTSSQNFYNIPIYKGDGLGSIYFFEKTIPIGTGNFSPIQINQINISPSIGQALKIAEILLFNRAVSNTEQNLITNYLKEKYAPIVNLGADINSYGFCPINLNASNRFVNYLWNNGNTNPLITINQPGIYSVTVTDVFGFQSSDTINIYKPNIPISDTAICLNSNTLIDTHLGPNYNYSWSNGATSSSITVSTAGNYSVTVTDTLGCSQSKTINVSADMFSVTATLGPDASKCIGDYIGLTNGGPAAEDYLWFDGSTDNSYLITGAGPISLIVSDTNGCVAMDTVNISIAGQVPITAFMSDTVCVGSSTTFIDFSSASPNSITNWFWEFGDGTTSTVSNPTHIYTQDGIFNVSLTSTSDAGCSKKITKQVLVLSLPNANFSPINACSGAPVNFLDKSICSFGNVTNWQWDFDDLSSGTQNTSILQNPTHTFNSPGSYHVLLIVKNKGLCSDTITRTITVKGAPNVDFNYTNTCEGTPVYFTDITSTPPYAAITEWNWDFGDGNYSQLANPNHNFDTANVYSVKLEIKSINGCIVSKTKPVIVNAIPFPDFTVNDLCQNTFYQLFDASTVENSTIIEWNWSFGNGIVSNQQNPFITYLDTGEYTAHLSIKSAASCIASTEKNIVVYPAPIAAFSFSPDYGIAPLLVEFTNLTNQANYFHWNFGDGSSTVSIENPNHTFTENGIYQTQLISTNLYGCKDTTFHEISVIPSSIDIALTKLITAQNNNFIKTTVNLVNLGTRNITNIELTSTLHQSNSIKENWTGLLKPGEYMTYHFTSEIEINPNKFPDYICAKAKISNIIDDYNPENDEQCNTSLTEFTVLDLYPNPSDDIINIEYVLPFDENIGFEIFDSNGKRINTIFFKESKKGLNKISLPTSFLNSGIYAIKITFNDNSIIKKFMKNN